MCRRDGRMVEDMDEIIRKLYEQMQMEKEYDDPIEQKLREELRQVLRFRAESVAERRLQSANEKKAAEVRRSEKCEKKEKQFTETQTASLDETRSDEKEKNATAYPNDLTEIDRLYSAAEIGEEAGFVRGFRYGFRLCMECMQEETVL